MKLKLDENVDVRVVSRLRLAGHDVATVSEQGLNAAPDTELIDVCRREERALVTADRGFGNRLRYNPADYEGIVVIRLPPLPTLAYWKEAIEVLILGLETSEVKGKLWILRQGKIFEYRAVE